jgi:NCS1 family nucleobase:cation symporter-1
MTTVLERFDAASDRGIDPVPASERVLSALDLAVLWGDLGIGLLVLVTGALLVPGLGFGTAVAAIILGSLVGVALLGLVAVAGADHGVPTMVLFRPILGTRGSWMPSVLNALQLIGWTAVELWAMSFVADLVAERVFGFSARWLWLAVAVVTCTWLALWGPVGVTRVWMKRFGAWVIVAICAAVTFLLLVRDGSWAAITRPASGGWPTFGPALDLVIAMPISWLPLVADYTRFATRPRAAFLGTFGGYLVANVWLYTVGCMLVLSTGATPDPAGIAGGILAVAGGSIAGVLFLVGLLVGETDEAFADIYSGAVCLQNISPKSSRKALTVGIAAIAAVLATWLTMERYETFLFLMGSVLVPLFGLLAAEYFVTRRRILDVAALYARRGPYWFSGGFRLQPLVPWAAGFITYQWIAPIGPEWWIDAVRALLGPALSVHWPWLPASLPSLGVAFLVTLMLPGGERGRPEAGEGGVGAYHPVAPTPER